MPGPKKSSSSKILVGISKSLASMVHHTKEETMRDVIADFKEERNNINFQDRARIVFQKKNPEINAQEYSLFSYKDDKNKIHYYMGKNQLLIGGEGTVRFGYKIDDKGKIADEEIVIKSLNRREEKEYELAVTNEIKASQIVHKNTSDIITFDDGTLGYTMEKLPGKDFAKKWSPYASILIYKGDDPPIFEKTDQIVLSKDKVYWIQEGKIESKDLSVLKQQTREAVNLYFDRSDNTELIIGVPVNSNQEQISRSLLKEIQTQTGCNPGRGLDCRAFLQPPLTLLQRCQAMRDIFEQLARLHKADCCHGDINPTNFKINIDDQGNAHAKLFDFGLSRFLDNKPFFTSSDPFGMPEFAAPETPDKKGQDKKNQDVYEYKYGKSTDIFSMAGIVGMMFTADPNDFIGARIAGEDKLAGKKTSERIVEASQTPYGFDKIFFGLTPPIDELLSVDQQNKFQDFVMRMANTNASTRPSSEEAFQFFAKMSQDLEMRPEPTTRPRSGYQP